MKKIKQILKTGGLGRADRAVVPASLGPQLGAASLLYRRSELPEVLRRLCLWQQPPSPGNGSCHTPVQYKSFKTSQNLSKPAWSLHLKSRMMDEDALCPSTHGDFSICKKTERSRVSVHIPGINGLRIYCFIRSEANHARMQPLKHSLLAS